MLNILLIGDVVGVTGRRMIERHLHTLRTTHGIDFVVVNGENSTNDGRGITPGIVHDFRRYGADVITTGNHIWKNKDIYSYWLNGANDLLRPFNFPSGVPGIGLTTINYKNSMIGVLNLQGRVFMHEQISCPFRAADSALTFLQSKTKIILVDFHAETTSEKAAIGYYLDGRVSAVVGTHTHVPTADEKILPGGTAFITDLGMVGARNGMLGMKKEGIINTFLTQMPSKFLVETAPPYQLCGVKIAVDPGSGKASSIERIHIIDTAMIVTD